jgi:hypothetical protein
MSEKEIEENGTLTGMIIRIRVSLSDNTIFRFLPVEIFEISTSILELTDKSQREITPFLELEFDKKKEITP